MSRLFHSNTSVRRVRLLANDSENRDAWSRLFYYVYVILILTVETFNLLINRFELLEKLSPQSVSPNTSVRQGLFLANDSKNRDAWSRLFFYTC